MSESKPIISGEQRQHSGTQTTWRTALLRFIIAYVVCAVFGVPSSQLYEGLNLEAAGISFLFSAFLIPSLILFLVLDKLLQRRWIPHVAFWLSVLPLTVGFLPVIFFPSAGASADASDEMAIYIITVYVGSAIGGYTTLLLTNRNNQPGIPL